MTLSSGGGKVETGGPTTADVKKKRNLESVSGVSRETAGGSWCQQVVLYTEVHRIIVTCIKYIVP